MSDAEFHQFLSGAKGRYLKAKELIEKSKNDSVEEPFKSKYAAAEIFRSIDTDLLNFDSKLSERETTHSSVISALLNYELGVISYDTEELSNCDKHLNNSWEIVKDDVMRPECIILAVDILNQLGILWSGRNEPKKAAEYLKQAEMLYAEYKLGKKPCPLESEDHFLVFNEYQPKVEKWDTLEKSLTLTLYYLAQVYEHLGDNESAAKYCHITLKRQIESKIYDPLDWAVNCATLSQYFVAKQKLSAARHVLACANIIMSEYRVKLEAEIVNKEDDKWQYFCRGQADISRCWAKYSIHVLALSSEQDNAPKNEKDDSENFVELYRLLKTNEVYEMESRITSDLIDNFDHAKLVFLFGIEQLKEAKSYYVLNEFTRDYVEIQQDNSKLYRMLTLFENDKERKCKMHKRRIDLLEDILKKLNPQYYLVTCRQLMMELAETYSEMLDIKIDIANSENKELPLHAVKKINYLADKSIEYYKSFITSLKDPKKELKAFSNDDVKPALICYFCMGRLYPKFIAQSQAKEIEYLRKSEDCYNYVLDYIDRNPEQEETVKAFLPLVREMVELIPAKIQKILGSTLY